MQIQHPPKNDIPKTMKAVQGKDYGDIHTMLTVEENVAVPSLQDLPPSKRKNFLLVKTLTVSLAPGDVRVLSGLTRELQGPPSFPYVPGGDLCGIVVEVPGDTAARNDEDLPLFRVGDRVAARFVEGPRGALGQYALVHVAVCDRVPPSLSDEDAAALASACPAVLLADRISPSEKRVLVTGAGGGLGSHVCQLLKEKGVPHIVGISKNPQRLLEDPIAIHQAINYTKQDVYTEIEEFQKEPFDVVLDLASGGWPRLLETSSSGEMIVKTASMGGRYLTTSPDQPTFEIHSIWGGLCIFLFPALRRALLSRTIWRKKMPKYTFAMSLPEERDCLTRTLHMATEGKLTACMEGPFSFTTDAVRRAFALQESRHAKGKVVIRVATKE
mmetsp:Transcript_12364/g.28631  ORF Transcript_12364/g.28631 Transcript_12364/m.28631 type:complete len:385 (+) Transcript_12364:107-1261(+)|eukprot:CAMPEP_0116841770 /NCGR_PEP_ID=MMETSP0418-20121206/11135_1 /TAXON_ID=1158023 /ORGANISM="Astrosyne radiata, Strain 13vi08-1A" /LENGTH=384 /DNA_ID=CAMNT_0004472285 /DNA_START=104 /DNA_END=1258 /DNA_ORIENTATION=+